MSQNCSNNSGRKHVPELYSQTILVRTGIAQFWYVLELLHVINNSGTYQNCTILERTRIEVAKYNMTKGRPSLCCLYSPTFHFTDVSFRLN